MPRSVPQIEVSFDIDSNGILNVSAVEKSTGKSNKIAIKNDKGRLSTADVERMIREAEQYKVDDEKMREMIEAKNHLENYCHSVKSSLMDEKVASAIPENDKKTITSTITYTLEWLNKNQSADKSAYENKQKEVENKIMPIMAKLGGGGLSEQSTPQTQKASAQPVPPATNAKGPKIEEVD